MKKSSTTIDFTSKEPLKERQRKLWAASDAIDLANYRNEPLPEELAHWLFMALRNIAFGEDANLVFDVVPEKRGQHKNGFKLEFERNFAISNIAAVKLSPIKKKTKASLEEIAKKLPNLKSSTVRANWNSKSAKREPGFTPGKK